MFDGTPSAPNSMTWSNGQGSRGRNAWLLLIKGDSITRFSGKSLPGLVDVRGTSYVKNGKWSHTTFRLELAAGVRAIAGWDGWETGRFIEGLRIAVSGSAPVDTWLDVSVALGVSVPSAMAFLRDWCPKAAEALDLVDAQLNALDAANRQIGITMFAVGRHFANPLFGGTRVVGATVEQLVALANQTLESGAELKDGYAPFCKHLFIQNTSPTKAGIARITPENAHLLRTGYEARREGELPVLTRWFEGLEAPVAEWLDLVLYTREQLDAEGATNPAITSDVPDEPWGIVSINGELLPCESPMSPMAMMRNALGKEEGGSGVPLNREAYLAAVEYWDHHATIR